MDDQDLLNPLRELEVEVHKACSNHDRKSIENLLHNSFLEFGRSGKTYTKSNILEQCSAQEIDFLVWSQEYALQHVSDDTVLLTYRSADISDRGDMKRYSLRSSLWVCEGKGWEMCFHQGTATGAFAKLG